MRKRDNTPVALLLIVCGLVTAGMAINTMGSGDMLSGILFFAIGAGSVAAGLMEMNDK